MRLVESILVIRLGALGDIVLCFQAFHDIRQANPDARIALLTSPAFVNFARAMPWFDEILVDDRAPGWRIDKWLGLRARLRRFNPKKVYDLQGKFRQTVLFYLLKGQRLEWSGAVPSCSHPRAWPPKPGMHFTDFVRAQLSNADVPLADLPDLAWLDAPLDDFTLPKDYIVLVPGCAPGRDYKRWPADSFAKLAIGFRKNRIRCVTVGTSTDSLAIRALRDLAPDIIDLSDKTTLLQLAALGRRARAVIGNDSGPTHLLAALGIPTLALISDRVNPQWSSPKGKASSWLQGHPLADLDADVVYATIQKKLEP